MTAVRLVYYVTDPILDARQPIAALVAAADGVVGGAVLAAPVPPGEAPEWARRALSDRAA